MSLYQTQIGTALGLFCASCATLPDEPGAKQDLPNAGAGPFRALVEEEMGNLRSAPNGLDESRTLARDPAIVDSDGDPRTPGVIGYFGATLAEEGKMPEPHERTNAILRFEARDGRSFDRKETTVLTAEEAWEGDVLKAPMALRVGGEIFLYYGAKGGIGLARSKDGLTFSRTPGPVLGPSMEAWEKGAVPSSPGVVSLTDGSFRMFYQIDFEAGGSAIGEASSLDGISWTRIGHAPALAPRSSFIKGEEEPYDSAAVSSPFPVLAETIEGPRILRVYYGARDTRGTSVIGLAARFGENGPLERAIQPVFGTAKPLDPREPCVLTFSGYSLLYVTQRASNTVDRPVVAVGLAPATASLPPPDPR